MNRLASITATALMLVALSVCAGDGEWLTDYPKALARAREEGKVVLLDFTGSDFCSACKTLRKEVFPKNEFVEYASQKLILVEVDFPLNKQLSEAQTKANNALKDQFKVDGFPTLILVDSNGRKLGEVDFDSSAKSMVKSIDKLRRKSAR